MRLLLVCEGEFLANLLSDAVPEVGERLEFIAAENAPATRSQGGRSRGPGRRFFIVAERRWEAVQTRTSSSVTCDLLLREVNDPSSRDEAQDEKADSSPIKPVKNKDGPEGEASDTSYAQFPARWF